MKATLYVICGLPASGKTTLAKEIVSKNNAILLSEDEWIKKLIKAYDNDEIRNGIANIHRSMAEEILKRGINVVMDGGYYSKEERDNIRTIAIEIVANFELHYMNIDVDETNARRIQRNKNLQVEFHTTDENFARAVTDFESPVETENFIEHNHK